ncbi:MAG: restriction endonuclease, partial [Treponema sp.]|nr:restriction endonuclease [Treponema sp.]
MGEAFFDHPILNSPYGYPERHWELDADGQPTQHIVESRRRAEFITPIPKPRKRKDAGGQTQAVQGSLVFDEGMGLSTEEQMYDPTAVINEIRRHVDAWRALPNPKDWNVTPETARLLQHWRTYRFTGIRPFFCQIEAAETLIWLTEAAPRMGKPEHSFLEHLKNANAEANPELLRICLKMATGAGKTTVMAM